METRQQTILHVLKARQIEHDTIDISAPGNQELRKFMREKGKKINGQRNALPPQIFNGEEHRFSYYQGVGWLAQKGKQTFVSSEEILRISILLTRMIILRSF